MFKIISPLFFVAFIFVNAVVSYFIKKANTVFVKKYCKLLTGLARFICKD